MEVNTSKSWKILTINTFAFTVCFAVWLMYGVLVKFLSMPVIVDGLLFENGYLGLNDLKFYIIATPILTGSIMRLPVGILTDKFGGKPIYIGVLLITALGALLTAFVDTAVGFMVSGLIFGMAGASFAVGIAFTSVWFDKSKQGTALGIFGAGNAGAAITVMCAPKLLSYLTEADGQIETVNSLGVAIKVTVLNNPDGWVVMPMIYAAIVAVTTIIFAFMATNRLADSSTSKTLKQRLSPLKNIQVWRLGFYYFLVFGGFVALSQTLTDYYTTVFGVTLATAGFLTSIFSLPSGVIRAAGGVWSDRSGARVVMYWILLTCIAGCVLLSFGVTNIWLFTIVACIVGIAMGIGKAAVYKHIPVYFPQEVGVVGGMVGVIGGLGGFICPIIFGLLSDFTKSESLPNGLYATSWMFLAGVSILCLIWMTLAIKQLDSQKTAPPSCGAVPADG